MEGEVWRATNWDKFNFLRGQKDVVERLKRAPKEINDMRESYKEESE